MGTLYIVATPIGNLEDITIRAIKTLFFVDYIACEDTRITGQLLQLLKEKYSSIYSSSEHSESRSLVRNSSRLRSNNMSHLISYYDEIEFKRVPEIIEILTSGKNVALVSDSGTPLISDPGFKLVRECIKKGIKVISISGPTSLITALTSSGLPPDKFLFLGYLPITQSKRINLLTEIKITYSSSERATASESRSLLNVQKRSSRQARTIKPTIIFLESPHRLKESLEDIKEIFGDIEIVIARELTKIHEEIWRGKISLAIKYFDKAKGEIVTLF